MSSLEVGGEFSPSGKHQPLLGGTCHCCGPGGIHSILPGFSPRNLPVNPVILKAWVDAGIKSVSVCSSLQQPWISKGTAAGVFGHSTTPLSIPHCQVLLCKTG